MTSRAFGLPARLDGAAAVVAPRAMNLAGARMEKRRKPVVVQAEQEAARAWRQVASTRLRRPALKQLVFGKKVDPAEVDVLLADLETLPGRSFSGFFEAITQHDLGHALAVLDDIPVEVMHGTRDRLLPPRHANRIAELIPSSRLWMYPGAGHMLMQERPRDVTHRLASLARKAVA
jgi:pimeloyl-ACP methyl ester carboxylesterase